MTDQNPASVTSWKTKSGIPNRVSTLKKGASLENLIDDLNLSEIIEEKVLGVYLYKTENRWCIGADYTSNYAWFFTKNHNLENAQFYKYEDDESIHRTSLKVDKIESTESFFVRESLSKGPLNSAERSAFLGSYVKLKGKIHLHVKSTFIWSIVLYDRRTYGVNNGVITVIYMFICSLDKIY